MNEPPQPTRVYLHLTPDMQRDLPASLDALLEQVGVALPDGITLSTAPMPVAEGEPVAKDVAIVINVTIDLAGDPGALAALIGTSAASVSGIIWAISRFLKDRGHTPRVVAVDEVVEVTGPDGKPVRQLKRVPMLLPVSVAQRGRPVGSMGSAGAWGQFSHRCISVADATAVQRGAPRAGRRTGATTSASASQEPDSSARLAAASAPRPGRASPGSAGFSRPWARRLQSPLVMLTSAGPGNRRGVQALRLPAL
jgi:hypothetical protein